MADAKISDLSDGSPVAAGDLFVLARGASNYKVDALTLSVLAQWTPISTSFTYSSADAPTYVCTTGSDLTGVIPVGARLRCAHASTTKYFIVTAVSSTTITLYGGTDYTLAATAITAVSFSVVKAPLGFPLDPAKWTVEVTQTTGPAKVSPTTNTWYGDTALSPTGPNVVVPIGCWVVSYWAVAEVSASGSSADMRISLSTSASSESDTDFTVASTYVGASGSVRGETWTTRTKPLTLAAKATYYLILKATASSGDINIRGDRVKTTIRAVCAYL